MKNNIKTRIKRSIAFLLAIILLWQTLPMQLLELQASGDHLIEVKLEDKDGNAIAGADLLKVCISENSIYDLTDIDEDGIYHLRDISISGNFVSGTYNVVIKMEGYEDVDKMVPFEKDGDVLKATINMSDYKKHTLIGTIVDSNGDEIEGAEIKVKRFEESEPVESYTTGKSGTYEISLLSGNYILDITHPYYMPETRVINNLDGDRNDTIPLKRSYGFNVQVNNPSDGTCKLEIVSGNGITIPVDGNAGRFEEGTVLRVTAEPKENSRLKKDIEDQMTSTKSSEEIDDGSGYYKDVTVPSKWPESTTYSIVFEKLDNTVVKTKAGKVTYIRNCPGGNVAVSGNQLVVIPAEKNYVSVKDEDGTVTETSRDGATRYYSVNEIEEGAATFSFQKDEEAPTLTLSANNLLLNKRIENNQYVDAEEDQEGANYWYINESSILFLKPKDDKTGIRDVGVVAEEVVSTKKLTDDLFYAEILDYFISYDASGTSISVTATDNADNPITKHIQAYYDNQPPIVKSISVNDAEYKCEQERKTYVGGDYARIKAELQDNYGISKMYYYISENGDIDKDELRNLFMNNKFLEQEVNSFTNESPDLYFDIDISDVGTTEGEKVWTVYVIAADLAGNYNLDDIHSTQFYKDSTPPELLPLEDVSGYTDEENFKRGTDSINLKTTLKDEHTPGHLSYYVSEPVAAGTDAYEKGITVSANDAKWIKVGDPDKSDKSYTKVIQDAQKQAQEAGQKPGTYRIWVYAKDGCGNISEKQGFTYHVDNVAPEVSDLTFDVKENGIFSLGNYFPFGYIFRKTQTVTIKVKAQDKSDGNYTGAESGIRDIKLFYVLETEEDTKEKYKYNIKNQRELPPIEEWDSAKTQDGTIYTFSLQKPADQRFYSLMVVAKDKAGNCTYHVPKDSDHKSDYIMVDGIAPTIKVQLESGIETPDSIQDGKNWYSKERALSYRVEMTDEHSGLFESNVAINEQKPVSEVYTTNETENPDKSKVRDKVITANDIDKKDGHVTIKASVQDNAGNSSEDSKTIYIDQDAPVISQILFSGKEEDELAALPTQYGFFFQNETKVTVKATDYIGNTSNYIGAKLEEGSGVKDFTYYTQDSKGNISKEVTLLPKKDKDGNYTATFTIPKGFKGQIYIKAQDQTGQETTYIQPKGTVIEDAKEHKKHSYANVTLPKTSRKDAQGNPLYREQPTISLKGQDTKSGIAALTWKVVTKAPETIQQDTVIQATYNDKTKKFDAVIQGDEEWNVSKSMDLNLVTEMERSLTPNQESNGIDVSLKLTDNAGNSQKETIETYSVDTTPPSVTVEYDNNDAKNEYYYDKPRKATITVTDANFSTEGCRIQISGGSAANSDWGHAPGSTCDGKNHAKDCRYTCTVDFSEDGEYTFGFSCTDLAGWEGGYDKTDHFVIDTTAPEIQVDYDNNDVRNENYYKEARRAVVTIVEENFDSSSVQVTATAKLDSGETMQPAIGGWSSGEEHHTAVMDFAYDGEYTLNIEYTDKAGNEAQSYGQDHFFIDTTEPEIIIEGVADRSANKGEVRPIVTCVESNLESSELSLTGANQGELKPEYEKATVGNKTMYHFADVEHVQEKDDIYTLQVSLIDKAGNEVEEKLLYSVNRFGSVYQYGKETSELLENYYTKEAQELQITETNVDTLTKSRITYSRGGEIVTLTEGEDYKVAMSGGEESMKQYNYTIYKENFEEEGEYSVVMTSQDAAENQSDNRLKGKEIQFVVDHTAPSIVFSGVEEKGQYEEHTREISLNVEDNIGTRNIEVWCDNQMIQSFDAEEVATGNGTVKANLMSSDDWQELTIVARDMAGNESRTEPVTFLLTTNTWIQWYNNKPVFYLTLAGAAAVVALAGAGVVFVGKKRRKLV